METGTMISFDPRFQGRIKAMGYDSEGAIWIAGPFGRIESYDLTEGRRLERTEPELTRTEKVFRFGIEPLYAVFPKPRELNEWAASLTLARSRTDPALEAPGSPRAAPQGLWSPLWSNMIFIVVMLVLGCLYLQRRDF
jgi:hypothetical protein